MATVNFKNLSEEQKKALREEWEKEEAEKKDKVKNQRLEYKKLVNEVIPSLFDKLVAVSAAMSAAKKACFNDLKALVELKAEAYDAKLDQYSHSFTTDDGITLIIGHRLNDGWDDTVNVGVQKVQDYISSLGTDENSKQLVKAVMQLLQKDQKSGLLKASRVLQLKKMADEIGNPQFSDAIDIIQNAYRPVKTKEFVTVRYKDNNGEQRDLPLDISAADFELKVERNGNAEAEA